LEGCGDASPVFEKDSRISCTAKNQYRKLKQIFPEKELLGHRPNFHIHVSVSDLFISTIDLPILLQEICGILTEAAQFPEKEHINGIFVAVHVYCTVFAFGKVPDRTSVSLPTSFTIYI
jgi:hypothetical protein